ncbi:hypothetical protein BITS_1764 [Bifidobacterium tsurumiense]|uniref:Uncharacterized protein n=1 Tax=Bifidobacterium tsurumiense TaxID=356829 RepID=A0A087EDB4_9BIFI|nr:hypothetical protein BITS_1764 [Bifidobacterium tsurumiense]
MRRQRKFSTFPDSTLKPAFIAYRFAVPQQNSYLIGNGQCGMIRPASIVTRRLVDNKSLCRLRELRSGELVIDTPASVIVKCPASLAPPSVWPLDISCEIAHDIDEFKFVQPTVNICPFFREEACFGYIALGIFEIGRRMRNIEISAEHSLSATLGSLFLQLPKSLKHGIEKTVFLFHLHRIFHIAMVHIYACHSDVIAFRRSDIVLYPAAGIHVLRQPRQTIATFSHRQVRQQSDAGTTFDTTNLIGAVQIGRIGNSRCADIFLTDLSDYWIDFFLWSTYFLHTPDIRSFGLCPIQHALALCGTNAVEIGRRNRDRHNTDHSSGLGQSLPHPLTDECR